MRVADPQSLLSWVASHPPSRWLASVSRRYGSTAADNTVRSDRLAFSFVHAVSRIFRRTLMLSSAALPMTHLPLLQPGRRLIFDADGLVIVVGYHPVAGNQRYPSARRWRAR